MTDTNLKFVILNTNIFISCYQLFLTTYFNLIHKSAPAKGEVSIFYVLRILPKPFVVKQYHIAVLYIGMKYPLIINHLQPIKSLNIIWNVIFSAVTNQYIIFTSIVVAFIIIIKPTLFAFSRIFRILLLSQIHFIYSS